MSYSVVDGLVQFYRRTAQHWGSNVTVTVTILYKEVSIDINHYADLYFYIIVYGLQLTVNISVRYELYWIFSSCWEADVKLRARR